MLPRDLPWDLGKEGHPGKRQRCLSEKLRKEVKVRPLASLEPQRGSPKLPPNGHKRPPHGADLQDIWTPRIKEKGERQTRKE